MKKFLLIFLNIFLMFLPLLHSDEVKPENLEYFCEDIPPSNYLENGVLTGVSVELLKLVWKKMDVPEQPIQVVPWARGYEQVQTEKNYVLFSMSRTKERENLFKWVGPIFSVKHVLLGLAENKTVLKTLDDAKKFKIGTIKDDESEQFLINTGFDRNSLESVTGLNQNFEKLVLGRIDFIAHSYDTFEKFIKINHDDIKKYKVFFVLSEKKNYYAFNNDTPDLLIERFQKALDSLKKEHLEILNKYGIGL